MIDVLLICKYSGGGHLDESERRYSPELLLTVLTSRCDFAEGSPPGLMVCTTQERLKIGTLYT